MIMNQKFANRIQQCLLAEEDQFRLCLGLQGAEESFDKRITVRALRRQPCVLPEQSKADRNRIGYPAAKPCKITGEFDRRSFLTVRGKAAALHEAKAWLRNLSADDAAKLAATIIYGVARGTRGLNKDFEPAPETPWN